MFIGTMLMSMTALKNIAMSLFLFDLIVVDIVKNPFSA
jgi:hypothetical protein